LLVILTRKLIQWSMALPLILFGNTSAAASFAESTRLTQGEKQKLVMLLVSWGLLSLLAGFLTLGMIKLLGQWSVPLVAESLTLTLILLGGLTTLWGLATFLLTTITSASFSGLLLVLYKHLAPTGKNQFVANQSLSTAKFPLRLTPKSMTALFALIAVAASLTGLWLINSIPTVNTTLVVAHRGAAGKAPENTLAAFDQAIKDKADWIEFDVQENAEGTIVVMHDSDFMKLAGNPVKTWETTADTLKDVDIGSWFDPAFSSERAPTLKQVLELSRGRVKAVIELKYYGHDEQLEQRVIDIIEQTGMVDEIAIMSLKYEGIQKVRALRPQWNVGLLSATALGDLSRLDTDFLAVAMGMASPGFIERAHQAGRKVFVWTVNDRISMSRMISLGVDGIITDEPELARQVLAEREDMNTVERLLMHTAQLFGEPYVPKQYRDNSP
jgi:glycerophosphoryl diester phosphodiesterase